jgi:aldehyde dehydrogenase (NAD+)
MANDTPYGLSAGIVTTSLKHAQPFQAQLAERPRDGQPADRGPRLSRAVRRAEEVELRPARAGHYAKEFYTIVKTSYVAAVVPAKFHDPASNLHEPWRKRRA